MPENNLVHLPKGYFTSIACGNPNGFASFFFESYAMVHALALLAFLPPPIRMAVTGEDFAKFNDYSLEIVSEILDDGAGVTPFTLGIFSRLATLF